jgi:hypothetical protein
MGNAPSEAGGYGFRIIQILKRENYLGILSPSSAGGITHAARRASSVLIKEQRSFHYEVHVTSLRIELFNERYVIP